MKFKQKFGWVSHIFGQNWIVPRYQNTGWWVSDLQKSKMQYSRPCVCIRLGVRCRVPPLPRRAPAYAKSIYDSSFAVTGPKLWNILPRSVTCAPSLESFKSRLTSHIMGSYPDLPPVPGYTSPNSNSLLDWSTGGLQQMS